MNKDSGLTNFDGYNLPIYNSLIKKFIPPKNLRLDDSQQCLVDNLFNSLHNSFNLCISINALSLYFNKMVEKPLGGNFSYYAIFKGLKKEIFVKWSEVIEIVKDDKNAIWQGYYQCFHNRTGHRTGKIIGSQFIGRTDGRTAVEPVM